MATTTATLTDIDDAVELTVDPGDNRACITLSGTYGTVTGVLEASSDGTVWDALAGLRLADNVWESGTLTLTDDDTIAWQVDCTLRRAVRFRVTALSTGSISAIAASGGYSGAMAPQAPATGALTAAQTTFLASENSVAVGLVSGAISAKQGIVMLTKAGVATMTLAAPTPTTDDGKTLKIIAATANAHTVTQTTPGFNDAGSGGDLATFGGAIGDNMVITAYQGVWYIVSSVNVVVN